MVFHTLRFVAVGLAAITLGYGGQWVAWGLNAFGFLLVLAAGVATALCLGGPGRARWVGELVTALVVVQGVSPVLLPIPAGTPFGGSGSDWENTISWRLAFTDERQAARQRIPVPHNWEVSDNYLRIDLGRRYTAGAGFEVEVNGVPVGRVSYASQAPWEGGLEDIQWWILVPRQALARGAGGAVAEVRLSPSGLDQRLTLAGHDDPRAAPAGPGASAFFDGASWSTDRLAGVAQPPARGTYRIFLDAQPARSG
jgi:hypothetical protein